MDKYAKAAQMACCCGTCKGGVILEAEEIMCGRAKRFMLTLRACAAVAYEDAADMLAARRPSDVPLTPDSSRLKWANRMTAKAAALRKPQGKP